MRRIRESDFVILGGMNTIQTMRLLSGSLLNPDLDLAAYHQRLDERGWVVIENALRPEIAEALEQVLASQVPWSLAYVDEGGSKKIWAEELQRLSAEQISAVEQKALLQARQGFSFLYHTYMMITAYQERRDPQLPLHKVTEYINKPEWLNVMRTITGEQRIIKTSAQATRYSAGHFLTLHNDHQDNELRYAAYVINLTREWKPDWGGLLHFIDEDGQVTDTVCPQFNCISLFKTPRLHCVSSVAPYVQAQRLTITGWLRGADTS